MMLGEKRRDGAGAKTCRVEMVGGEERPSSAEAYKRELAQVHQEPDRATNKKRMAREQG